MTRISCGHCGGVHTSVAEVRACSAQSEPRPSEPARSVTTTAGRPDLPIAKPQVANTADTGPTDLDPLTLAGPACLGRSVLIGPGGPVPEPWVDCQEIEVNLSEPVLPKTMDQLQQAWSDRIRSVIRCDRSELPEPGDRPVTFSDLGPATEVKNDRLRFLLTANAVNLLGQHPSFDPLTMGLGNGSSPSGDGIGDAAFPDGSRAWLDGGPLDLNLVDHPDLGDASLVPRCHLVAGSTRSLQSRRTTPTDQAVTSDELATDQRSAIEHRGGPARILAPAGSGKTRVLTERVRFLVDGCGVEPAALALVAYNRRAKAEMSNRLAGTGRYHLDSIRTLNSLALAIATGRGGFVGGTPATTITEREVRRILGGMMPRQRRRQLNDPLEPWVDALSMTRLGLRDPDEVADEFSGDLDGFGDVFGRYRQHLVDHNLVDFDEQILRAVEILVGNRAARERARRLMSLILIDEFQDLTPAHLLLIRLIAGPANEVFAVGDDDQTIYSYSGASPRWLIDFEQFFPHAASHFLTVNYRCPAAVVTAADNLLSHNRHRVDKTIEAAATQPKSTAESPADGTADGTVNDLTVYSKGDPQENLVAHVGALLAAGAEPGDIAVLARVNAALLPAMMYLAESGVVVNRPPAVDVSMLERSGAGAALAWLRLASATPNDLQADDLRLALRRPPRSVHPRIVDWICEQQSVGHLEKLADRLNTERDSASVRGLAADIAELQSMMDGDGDTEALLNHIYYEIGLLGAAGQLDGSQRTARRAAHSDELLALLAVARLHPDPDTFETWLRTRITAMPTSGGSAGPGTERNQPEGHSPDTVTLATVHTTKGLEWPHVVVHDVRDGLYPHRLADDTEEERRIFHVGITRGRESVALTCSGPRSPFVDELSAKRTQPWPVNPDPVVSREGRSAAGGTRKKSGAKANSVKPKRAEPATESEAKRRDALADWRRQRAKSDSVPAYVVLNNKTLDAIAASAPGSLTELSAVAGIGPSRLEQYGDEILGVVAGIG